MARSDIHDWERQLQENRSRARDMSTASMRREPALRLDGLDESPRRPNLHGRAMHIPTRTSSNKIPTMRDVASATPPPPPPPKSIPPTSPLRQYDQYHQQQYYHRHQHHHQHQQQQQQQQQQQYQSFRQSRQSQHPTTPTGAPPPPMAHYPRTSESGSASDSFGTSDTRATSVLPPLQVKGSIEDGDSLSPIHDDDPSSFDLIQPRNSKLRSYSLEHRSAQLFSREHLEVIFADPSLLLRFTSFLTACRPLSVQILIYHLDAIKALRAISYSNAVADSLGPLPGHDFTVTPARPTVNSVLEDKARRAFDVLVRDDLPAYVTHIYTQVVSRSITKRITGTLSPRLRDASEGLAEVFCLTDPNRPDNPIIFASEEFYRTTQYGMSYAIGRNCRFLQGPRTNPDSVDRLRQAVVSGQQHCEVFLNYRRDGSPFMNLLMISPLRDSKGEVRYHIGAQVDVSGIVKECTDLESLRRLVLRDEAEAEAEVEPKKDAFQELSEMFNMHELETVRRFGGRMHKEMEDVDVDVDVGVNIWHRPRLLLSDPSPETLRPPQFPSRFGGELSGVYKNYLLVRPYPSLRVLFASPSLRVPGILQSPFLAKIGGSARVRDELTKALAEGRGVTAKVRWQSRGHEEGRNRWIHCTPLVGADSKIGVWMVVIVDDDDDDHDAVRRQRVAPPVDPNLGRSRHMVSERQMMSDREMESERGDFPLRSRRDQPLARSRSPPVVHVYNERASIESRCFPDLDVELNVDRPRSANSSRQPDPLLNPL